MPYNVLRKPILIIDPGHGGKDPGAVSKYGREEDWTLKISLYQYERFQALGVPVVISRTKDVDLEENERVSTVKNSGATYCFSNHLNAGGGDRAEVIHSIYDDGELANLIKEELEAVGQETVKVYTRKGSNGADYYYMNRRTGAVKTNIIEYCFLDNEADFKHFSENWKAYAEAPIKAFCKHIKHPYKPLEQKEGWKKENGKWFFYEKGKKETGWVKWKNKWYFLNDQGEMQNGWIKDKGKWYYLNPDPDKGEMMTGTVTYKGKLYYLNPDGSMAENTPVNVTLKAGKDGALAP
ncbi:N-acetylmuramoyl-L-alanine amidase family protein [Mesobacillus sp. S13]|uniref:N-acetylmuramoyl-L-alanine amidase family protein n=1 Tax=Mesobacillus sp. S13 TaxID=2880221 RepID=UPI001CF260BC|nr:N-acetylmuramoyl-L-alanine amidase [Mesobacillus sp. S13]